MDIESLETKSLLDGKLLFVDDDGVPNQEHCFIWFLWYRKKQQKYRILLKTFSTDKEATINCREKMKKKIKDCEISLGTINIINGYMKLFSEKYIEEFYTN